MMQCHAIEKVMRNIAHQDLCPVIIRFVGATRYSENLAAIRPVGHEGGVLPIDVSIMLNFHITPTAPRFITYSPELNVPCFFSPILQAQLAHRAFTIKIYILDP